MKKAICLLVLLNIPSYTQPICLSWGFYAHKLINRKAVFTLPQDMFGFFKEHIDYISEHAVDPDKRRYALKNEFARHYIDVDQWDTIPFPNLPRNYAAACMKYGELLWIHNMDTLSLTVIDSLARTMYYSHIHPQRFSLECELQMDQVLDYIDVEYVGVVQDWNKGDVVFRNSLVAYGVLPWFLEDFQKKLVNAFKSQESSAILRMCADMGHYLSDAHVPLHTTLNYNGQLTGQKGLHAFWESRLPELFAEDSYDFMVGKAQYIEDYRAEIWKIITESHTLLDSIFLLEKELRALVPPENQFCYETRNHLIVKTQCAEYAGMYHNSLRGMVEKRMQHAILAIGSFWYSAWVDAGQPELLWRSEAKQGTEAYLKDNFQYRDTIYGRSH